MENKYEELVTDDDSELVPDEYFRSADVKFGYERADRCDYETSDGADDPSFAWCGKDVDHVGEHGDWYGELPTN